MDQSVRWTIKVSRDTDISVRTLLARRGMKKGDLSRFIEDAVRGHVLDQATQDAKRQNRRVAVRTLLGAIDDAVADVRSMRRPTRAR
jgi:Cu/Ag efflux pump CusA